jgi:hypothetical protein
MEYHQGRAAKALQANKIIPSLPVLLQPNNNVTSCQSFSEDKDMF